MWWSSAQGDQHPIPLAKKLTSHAPSLAGAVPLSFSVLEFLVQNLSGEMLERTALWHRQCLKLACLARHRPSLPPHRSPALNKMQRPLLLQLEHDT
jgi:hypothetical protein